MKRNSKSAKALLIALVAIPCLAQASLLKVTANGSISNIFGFSDPGVVPFAVGDSFSYNLIVSDNPALDTNPFPNITRHSYSPNFQDNVAGAASLTFDTYQIPVTNVSDTGLLIDDDPLFGDSIEIGSAVSGAPLIDGIAPTFFSIKMTDATGVALSSADISPAIFLSPAFAGQANVILFMESRSGSCGSSRCAVMAIDSISVETIATPVPAAAWLFGSGLLGLTGLARRKPTRQAVEKTSTSH